MGSSKYIALYALQDEVLETVFEEPSGFYLTGGTALSRYYLNHRYSDDLDFFDHDIAAVPFIARKSLNEYASDLEKINRDIGLQHANSLAEGLAIEL